MFIGLHRHSHYSKRDAIAKIPDIVRRVGELGQTAWALTDHGTTSGLMEAYKATQKYNTEHNTNIKFIFGCEAYWIPSYYIKDRKQSCHILFLVKNQTGYRNLLRLVTIGYGDKGESPDNYFYTMRLTTEDIKKYSEGLIISSACMGGFLNSMTPDMEWDKTLAYDRARDFKNDFGDSFFLEIQCATDSKQIEYNKRIIEMSKYLNIPVFVTEDSHYVDRTEANTHRKWLGVEKLDFETYLRRAGDSWANNDAIRMKELKRQFEQKKAMAYYQTNDYYIHSEEEVRSALNYLDTATIDEVINNTQRISDMCEAVKIEFGGKHFPELKLDTTPLEAVKQKCRDNWTRKMQNVPKSEWSVYVKQLEHEFDILEKCGYLEYFLMTEDFISHCRSEGIRMGVGRGSVGGCLVAYLMDITRIDPIKYGLIFERFAHDKRTSLPDVDIDLPNTRRQEAIQYLKDKYGEVFHVRSFGLMGEKAAITRAANALGYKPSEVKKLKAECGSSIENIQNPELKELASQFVGVLQNNTVHASAVMLFPSDATEWCAIERQGDEYVCAYEYHDLEAQGLLKEDVLGIKTLDAIDSCIKLIGREIDIDNLPDDDSKTFDMLNREDVLGCFQIESAGMVKIINKIKPKSIFDLVPLVALYRPSTIQSGMVDEFCDRRNGKSFRYLHPNLEKSLSETYGVMLYQEQAMKIVQDMAGYDLGMADMFRRAIGRKIPEEMAELIPKFVDGCKRNGISEVIAKELAEWLSNAASYQFNKSHSAAYGVTCYQTAYLKANYPAEYLCAYLNAYTGDKQEDLLPYINEIKAHGIKLLPPDADQGSLDWQIVEKNGEKAIRMAISYITGVGKIPLPVTPESFWRLNKSKAENLIKAGALDYLGDRRDLLRCLYSKRSVEKLQKQLERAKELCSKNEGICKECKDAQSKKFLDAKVKRDKYEMQVFDIRQKIKNAEESFEEYDESAGEREVLGMSFHNPFDGYNLSEFSEPNKNSKDYRIVLGMVRSIRPWKQKDGKPMAFFTIECPSGKSYDMIMFNSSYAPIEKGKVYAMTVQGNKLKRIL